ncbi:glycerophosphodiester phosphodiesterase [Lactobacillus sp. CBA3605]|uniref:glycerophosphodiester phosphodiesterase n=1 Tax=Lactobacillus sp. CBA3605 TaxID=2099788 RepID=UPI000CFCA6AD|nr:glycerophosphodiester phosphodiesterase [Lactobacillus sp. CBA3605]AVK60791.1 glycerophosphodiester phosphodiesterase [Lactobacillus sp. CBA3605]
MRSRGWQVINRGVQQLQGPLTLWWSGGLAVALGVKVLGIQFGGMISLFGLLGLSCWLPWLAEKSAARTWSWRQRRLIWALQLLLGLIWLPLGWGGYLATLQASIRLAVPLQNSLFMTRYDWGPWVGGGWLCLWLVAFKWLPSWRQQLRQPTTWRAWWTMGWQTSWWSVIKRLLRGLVPLIGWGILASSLLVALTFGIEQLNVTAGRLMAIVSLATLQSGVWLVLAGSWGLLVAPMQPQRQRLGRYLMLVLVGLNLGYATWWLQTPPKTTPAVIAHRGVNGPDGVQNTTSALKRTVKAAQPTMVEMDIQPTADRHWVVMHDATLTNLARRPGPVADYRLDQLAGLPLREHGHRGELSTFDHYLATSKQLKQPLLVEIKAVGNVAPLMTPFANRYAATIEQRHDAVHSLDYQVVLRLKQHTPQLRVGYIMPFYLTNLAPNQADFYSLQALTVTREQLTAANREHKAVYLWTVDRRLALSRLAVSGATGLITNQPGRLRQLQKRPQHYYGYQLINWLMGWL